MSRAAAAAAGLALLLVQVAGCGSSRNAPPLAWVGSPRAFSLRDLPSDRVVLARVRNVSSAPLRLEAAKLVVHDHAGRRVKSSAEFIGAYAHGLYGAFQKPAPLPPDELTRLGLVVTLAPHATAPLTVAWRIAPGTAEPVAVDYGAGSLRLPAGVRPAAR